MSCSGQQVVSRIYKSIPAGTVISEDEKTVTQNGKPALFCMAQRYFNAGDTLKLQVKHTRGTALNLLAQGDHSPDIILCKVV